VRRVLYAAAVLAVAALSSPETLRGALATSASALFEATPWALAGIVAAHLLRRHHHALAYLGCGCGRGPSARSLPAAAATCLLFGPIVALLRVIAASAVAHVLERNHRCAMQTYAPTHLLAELAGVFPAALLAGASIQLFAGVDPARMRPLAQMFAGALLGFSAAPCGLGAVTLAGALHARAPFAAAAFLCIAGILDLRALRIARSHHTPERDGLAYAMLAAALGIVALRRGDALVHPVIAPLLGICAIVTLDGAFRYRRCVSPAARLAPGLMLIGALAGAPPPQYSATETTLTDLFPGERLVFTGALSRDGRNDALVRYAITCCRADAAPVAVRLDRALPYAAGTWLRIDGAVARSNGELRLHPQRIERIAPPSDPFIYR
jgi:hypothetical protein